MKTKNSLWSISPKKLLLKPYETAQALRPTVARHGLLVSWWILVRWENAQSTNGHFGGERAMRAIVSFLVASACWRVLC